MSKPVACADCAYHKSDGFYREFCTHPDNAHMGDLVSGDPPQCYEARSFSGSKCKESGNLFVRKNQAIEYKTGVQIPKPESIAKLSQPATPLVERKKKKASKFIRLAFMFFDKPDKFDKLLTRWLRS